MNRVELSGKIANDIELRKTATNKSVVNFALAVKKNTKNENGEREVDFIDVIVWEQSAEYLNNYACKGATIEVEGRLSVQSYTDKNGVKRRNQPVIAEHVEILRMPERKTEQMPLGVNHETNASINQPVRNLTPADYSDIDFY